MFELRLQRYARTIRGFFRRLTLFILQCFPDSESLRPYLGNGTLNVQMPRGSSRTAVLRMLAVKSMHYAAGHFVGNCKYQSQKCFLHSCAFVSVCFGPAMSLQTYESPLAS